MTWWRRTPVRVVIWSRAGCHLCAEMEATVRAVAGSRGTPPVEVVVRDLDEAGRDDPGLLARLSALVPVLEVDGVQVARWSVEAATVRAALRGRPPPR
ncbi:glutaredoxin family protein [Ornithinimicrobium cerasi]|uniref:Glutaredoxin-like domain n=1 Tax=Ornithinimicrobium cerasi TaxID=2248773 RepID=A0A285VQM7_9MICO|nr:glutaredoxin family protein [Ornithinimicrobium cerasi]SOC56362.1 Glutaredoxin-like domain [Ornithinimicrobium cerasi]